MSTQADDTAIQICCKPSMWHTTTTAVGFLEWPSAHLPVLVCMPDQLKEPSRAAHLPHVNTPITAYMLIYDCGVKCC